MEQQQTSPVNLAELRHDEATSTWSAHFGDHVLAKSVGGESSRQYVIKRIRERKIALALKLGVFDFSNVEPVEAFAAGEAAKLYVPAAPRVKPNNTLSVVERYELLDECVDISIRKDSGIRSLIITGEGSVGKTFHTKERLKAAGLKSTEEAMTEAYTLLPNEAVAAKLIDEKLKEYIAIAVAYYKEKGLPKPVKSKGNDVAYDDDDEGSDEDDEEDSEQDRWAEFKKAMTIGVPTDYTYLHNSREIRERCCAAQYLPGSRGFRFNIKLAVANLEETLQETCPHEVAHMVMHAVYPQLARQEKKVHGKEWKRIMRVIFNCEPEILHTMDTDDVRRAPDLAGDYHYIKGYSSAKGLYRTLYENRHKLVVFDDADSAWKNEISANILKAALDSDADRWISWNAEQVGNDDLPRRFLFEGKVIFISNVSSEDFPQPLITRALRCDIEMTMDEKFERMRQILPSDKFAPGVSMKIRQMSYDFLYENRDIAREISTRCLLNVIMVANSGSKLWKRIALSNIA